MAGDEKEEDEEEEVDETVRLFEAVQVGRRRRRRRQLLCRDLRRGVALLDDAHASGNSGPHSTDLVAVVCFCPAGMGASSGRRPAAGERGGQVSGQYSRGPHHPQGGGRAGTHAPHRGLERHALPVMITARVVQCKGDGQPLTTDCLVWQAPAAKSKEAVWPSMVVGIWTLLTLVIHE